MCTESRSSKNVVVFYVILIHEVEAFMFIHIQYIIVVCTKFGDDHFFLLCFNLFFIYYIMLYLTIQCWTLKRHAPYLDQNDDLVLLLVSRSLACKWSWAETSFEYLVFILWWLHAFELGLHCADYYTRRIVFTPPFDCKI